MRRAWLPVAAVALAGCGIDPQSAPEDVDISPIPPVSAEPTASSPGPQVTLWFLRDDQLAPVTRAATAGEPGTALELLADGPDSAEADDGLTTALARQPLVVADAEGDTTVLTVEVTDAFTSVPGEDQLRAVAQVVWTVTEFDGVDAVRFLADAESLEVPTDRGLSDQPVDRTDYASLAPDGPPGEPAGTPAGAT